MFLEGCLSFGTATCILAGEQLLRARIKQELAEEPNLEGLQPQEEAAGILVLSARKGFLGWVFILPPLPIFYQQDFAGQPQVLLGDGLHLLTISPKGSSHLAQHLMQSQQGMSKPKPEHIWTSLNCRHRARGLETESHLQAAKSLSGTECARNSPRTSSCNNICRYSWCLLPSSKATAWS